MAQSNGCGDVPASDSSSSTRSVADDTVDSFRATLDSTEVIERSSGSIRVLDGNTLNLLSRLKLDTCTLEVYPPETLSDSELYAFCYRVAWLALYGAQAGAQEQAIKSDGPTVDVVVPTADPHLSIPSTRGAVFQLFELASPLRALPPFPRTPAQTKTTFGLVSHPLRPPTPVASSRYLYSRWIPHLSAFFALRTATEDDLQLLHGWLNSSRVNEFWGDASDDIEKHREFIRSRLDDPHTEPVIGSYIDRKGNAKDAIYVDLYWAKEDRLGEHYEAQDYDQGVHLFVGSELHRGSDYLRAWLPSVVHYMFLRDARTQRVVAEPNCKNENMLSIFAKFAGMEKQKTFHFPHKEAALMMATRDEFFEGTFL